MERHPMTSLFCRRLLAGCFGLIFFLAICQAGSAQTLPYDTYQLSIHSQPGDPWSRGGHSDWFYQPSTAIFYPPEAAGYSPSDINYFVAVVRDRTTGATWDLTFDFRRVGTMAVGEYDNATSDPGPYPELDISGLGGACGGRTGKFSILDFAIENRPSYGWVVTRFAATFEQHCYGLAPALTGAFYYHSNGFPPPPPMQITQNPALPDATAGIFYSQSLQAQGGVPPYNWTLLSEALPPGLVLDLNGTISGVPTAVGKYSFRLMVTDWATIQTGWPNQLLLSNFSLNVNPFVPPPPAPFSIPAGVPPTASQGSRYDYQFAAAGGVPPYKWSLIDGQLPTGLTLSEDGKLSGLPTRLGLFTFKLHATDSNNQQADRAYTVGVIDPPTIDTAKYKVNKRKLIITGKRFDSMATLMIDGQVVSPNSHDSENYVVKALSLERGMHELRVMNPDGGTAAVTITVE